MPETKINKTIEGIYNKAYNRGLEHAAGIVRQHYIYGHTVVSPLLDSVIKHIESMKSCDEPEDKEHDNGLEETMIHHEREARISD